MKHVVLTLILMITLFLNAAAQDRPTYCDDIPVMYDKTVSAKAALPKFSTAAVKEYKVQVAILKFTHPKDYPFHRSLVARYRPCEQVWVVESRESFSDRKEAEELQAELKRLGYKGAYLIELLGYQ
ncbi:MAG TPA: hypothetical protein VJ933_08865 [Phaeodactylibacter sp.]|nr:hypothetical protein [Phaeodactylibacter sp.]